MQKFRRALERSKQGHVQRFKRWQKHPFGVPIMLFVGLVVVGGALLLILSQTHSTTEFHPYTSYIVIINHDGITQTVPTDEPTVGALLHKLNIAVGPHDRVEPTLNTPIVEDNFRVNVYRAVPVTITDGTTNYIEYSAAATPRSIVTDAGIQLYPEDTVSVMPAADIVREQSIVEHVVIDRAVPVILNDYGVELQLRTHATTVGQLLVDENIHLEPADSVTPALTTPITPELEIFVNRKGTQIVTQTQTIAYPVQTVQDNTLSFGTQVTRQQGSNGTEVLTYQVNTVNGKPVSQTLLQTVVTVQPVPAIVAEGQAVSIPSNTEAVMAEAGIAPSDYPYVNFIASHEGGWCPTKIQGTHNCPGYMTAAQVPPYGGYGIFQATPGSKMASAGSDWVTNPVTQIRWATSYADSRYGSWEAAYNHWQANHNW